jgi:hypothetical protein
MKSILDGYLDGWIINLHHPFISEREMTIYTHVILILRVARGLEG